MRLLGNICWFIFGGFISGMAWVLSGALWCITIIGIPYGLQCFKFATISFWPFGRRIIPRECDLVSCKWLVDGTR